MSHPSHHQRPPCIEESTRQFILWGLATLGLSVESPDERICSVLLPESLRASLGGAESIRFTFQRQEKGVYSPVECAELGSRVYCWLVDQLRRTGAAVHASPRRQPVSVHEISPRLFEAYQVDGGSVHLRGCTLEDQPLLRLTYRVRDAGGSGRERLANVYAAIDGRAVDPWLIEALHADELGPPPNRPPRVASAEMDRWLGAAKRLADGQLRREDEQLTTTLEVAAVIWCKYAEGKLAFAIGQKTVESPFAGWAQFFADRRIKPPPYACPLSGKQSYHLTAADDGRISVAEAIAVCQQSNLRVLENDLETCAATGKRVLPEFLEPCPVSGDRVLRSTLVICPRCHQRVGPDAVEKDRCSACRGVRRVDSDDPRLARVLERHPGLRRWRKWKLAETAAVYILVGSNVLRRLLVVVDKEDLAPRHVATSDYVLGRWWEAEEEARGDYLR